MTWVLDEGDFFLLYLALSTERRDETTFPSCHHPHNTFTIQGGGKKEGTSPDRYLWCCRRSCHAVTPEVGGKVQEQLCSTVAPWQWAGTTFPFLYFTLLYFFSPLICLALWGCGHCHFQTPHQDVSLSFVIGWSTSRYSHAKLLGRPPLLLFFGQRWAIVLTLARDNCKESCREVC